MQENDQGFEIIKQSELIDYNYYPLCTSHQICPKIRKKIKQQTPLYSSPFINQESRKKFVEQVRQQKISKQEENLTIFNNFNKKDIKLIDNNIQFSSNFQSGNLQLVIRHKNDPLHYNLYIRPDTNTKGHYQWFYFKVSIKSAKLTLTFTIKNLLKANMLYKRGLKPYYHTQKRGNLDFEQIPSNNLIYEEDEQTRYYNLTFSHSFNQDNDQVQFSSQPPYTFKKLTSLISTLKCQKQILCKSVMGINTPYLIYQSKKQCKYVCFVIARQHPGESVSSYLMQGFLKKLQIQFKYNKTIIKDHVCWIVIPMVNVDGVILGNNRTGVMGKDFNRNWEIDNSQKNYQKMFPQIYEINKLIKKYKKKYPGKIKLFLDLHGHSSQPNVFTYGPPHQNYSDYYCLSRLFPQIIAQRNRYFNISQCSYVLNYEKKKTARYIAYYYYGIPFTYTIQTTFGMLLGKPAQTDDFLKIGGDIASSVYQFLNEAFQKIKKQNGKNYLDDLKLKYYQNKQKQIQQFETDSDDSYESQCQQKFRQKIQQIWSKQQQKLLKQHSNPHLNKNKTKSLTSKNTKMITESSYLPEINRIKIPRSKIGSDYTYNQCLLDQQIQSTKFSIQDIRSRLLKLKNSKFGKKILVVNAYGI